MLKSNIKFSQNIFNLIFQKNKTFVNIQQRLFIKKTKKEKNDATFFQSIRNKFLIKKTDEAKKLEEEENKIDITSLKMQQEVTEMSIQDHEREILDKEESASEVKMPYLETKVVELEKIYDTYEELKKTIKFEFYANYETRKQYNYKIFETEIKPTLDNLRKNGYKEEQIHVILKNSYIYILKYF